MKTSTDTSNDRSDIYRSLDTVRMSNADRRHARASLRDAELIADLLFRAAADMRSIAGFVEHGAMNLANAVRAIFAKPAKL